MSCKIRELIMKQKLVEILDKEMTQETLENKGDYAYLWVLQLPVIKFSNFIFF